MTSKRQSWVLLLAGKLRPALVAGMVVTAGGCSTVSPTTSEMPAIRPVVDKVAKRESEKAAGGTSESARSDREVTQAKPKRRRKWNPIWWIGNADDPEPPDWYRPGRQCRRTRWHLRNPFHNFTFYVIGIADKDFERTGTHPEHVFNPDGGWTRAVAKYKCWRLPFVSCIRGDFKFYIGWRERGNFGLKLTF